MPKPEQTEAQRTNELLEKLLVIQLRGQGASRDQIAKFLGKGTHAISDMLRVIRPGDKE